MKGRIFKTISFEADPCADGFMIEKLWSEYPHESFTFMPQVYHWFNYFEDGRWNDFKRK